MPELKVPAAAAAVAFVLSFLTGVLSGNPMLRVLLTALLISVAFAGLAFIVKFLIARFLPELLVDSPGSYEPVATGSNVDISIGDNDSPASFFTPARDDDGSEMPDFASRSSFSADTQDSAYTDQLDDSSMDNETEAFPNRKSDAHSSPASSPAVSGSPLQSAPAAKATTSGGLDILPDLHDFSVAPAGSRNSSISDHNNDFSDDLGVSGSSQNSAIAETDLMAKAIRTILAKDT